MKVLLIENDDDVIDVLREAADAASEPIELILARSMDSALAALGNVRADLVIFDLQIPTTDGALDEDVVHGMSVFHEAAVLAPGVPRIVWSGRATNREFEQIIEAKTHGDPYGLDQPTPMLEFFNKGDLRKCAARVVEIARHHEALASVRISMEPAPFALSEDECAVLRLHARRVGAELVRVEELAGGLSDARAFRVHARTTGGHLRSRILAKIGPVALPEDEILRFRKYVTAVLDGSNFAPFAGEVKEGAGPLGGCFYGLLEEFENSLFGLLAYGGDDADHKASDLVGLVRVATENWHGQGVQAATTIEVIRKTLVRNERKDRVRPMVSVDLDALDEMKLLARACTQHGDLHGDNVLVAADGRPVLIDFAKTGPAHAALDPVTLELSLLFHPGSPLRSGPWPEPGQAQRWAFLDEYLHGCPAPRFVRACREWAFGVAAEASEVHAHVACYAMRQLDYDDTNKVWAHGLFDGACEVLGV